MGIFDKLKKASDNLFDGFKKNTTDTNLANAREKNIKKEVLVKTENKKIAETQLDKILLSIPKPKLSSLTENELSEIRLKKELAEIDKTKKNEKTKEEREKLKSFFIEKYGKDIGLKIFNKKLFIGMTLEMLKDVKGRHSEKVENVTNGKVKVKLYYEKSKNRLGNISYGFEVSLENDLVVGWKDRKNKGSKKG
jgi:hypothetical protein